eukprot:1598040-Pleurochrysis_carterae.AAC.2
MDRGDGGENSMLCGHFWCYTGRVERYAAGRSGELQHGWREEEESGNAGGGAYSHVESLGRASACFRAEAWVCLSAWAWAC